MFVMITRSHGCSRQSIYAMAYEQILNSRILRFRHYYINTSITVLELIWRILGSYDDSHAVCLNKLSVSLRWCVLINQGSSPGFFHFCNACLIFTFCMKWFKFS